MRRLFLGLLGLTIYGCSSAGTDAQFDDVPAVGPDPGGTAAAGTSGDFGEGSTGAGDSAGTPGPTGAGTTGGSGGGVGIEPGTLTAGTWDDNRNFDFFTKYVASEAQLAGAPAVSIADRMQICVNDSQGAPVGGATIEVDADGASAFTTVSGAEGCVYFFPSWYGVAADAKLAFKASANGASAAASPQLGDVSTTLVLAAPAAPVSGLDIALVVDTTGSMGDELAYLQVELDAIASGVAKSFPNVDARWALVFYRDVGMGDTYTVQTFNFTGDLNAVETNLNAQSAAGGGDIPEAVDVGLTAASQLSWRSGNVARLAFWIADAPQHNDKTPIVMTAIQSAQKQGVHIYPISASGSDDLLELTMRTAAETTAGRYLFLTDDSGVGDPHQVPTIPCFFVTKLNAAINRMIHIELAGQYEDPNAADILRVGGDPMNRICDLPDGTKVEAF